ncbi:Dullard phosphatase domain containing protein, eukaryotic [Tanacetum coccineum]
MSRTFQTRYPRRSPLFADCDFTAGVEANASAILDKLDPKGLISHRLYRSSCKNLDGKLAKDLSGLGRNLKNVVIIDDRPNFYRLQPENGIPITPFTYYNARDGELKKLIDKFFNNCDQYEDLSEKMYTIALFGS